MAIARVEPFEFFTMEALKAGWYLNWRLWLRSLLIFVPIAVVVGLAAFAGAGMLAPLAIVAGGAAYIYFWIRWTNEIAGAWTMQQYGRPLNEGVWWGIVWRSFLISIAMSIGVGVAQVLFSGAFALVGAIVAFGLGVAQIVMTLQASGWAMSIEVAKQLGSGGGVVTAAAAPTASAAAPAPAAPAPKPVAVEPGGKLQCPKCGLYETVKGTVIGWHCRICGWREGTS